MIGAVSGVPRLHGIFAGKHFSFSGVILFPSFMLLLCSVADYLVKKRKPSFLCLPTLHTSLKRIQWVQFLVTWNTDWEREKKNKQTNKQSTGLFSDQNWCTFFLHQNLCRAEWSCSLFSLTGIYTCCSFLHAKYKRTRYRGGKEAGVHVSPRC